MVIIISLNHDVQAILIHCIIPCVVRNQRLAPRFSLEVDYHEILAIYASEATLLLP